MRLLRFATLMACLVSNVLLFGQKEDWQPITAADQQIKEAPGNPGASAIMLYYSQFIDDKNGSQFTYRRIKVLTEKGREPGGVADVEIVVGAGFSIGGLKARTIHPDGSIVEFTGKPFEKTIIKGKGIKVLAKTFTMPDVTVGSIIEYKYHIYTPEGVVYESNWEIQHDLYTVKEDLAFKSYEGDLETDSGLGSGFSWVTMNMDKKPTMRGNTVELHMDNVPAFTAEGYMPPEEEYKPNVRFFYGGRELSSADKFWQEYGKRRNSETEHFIGAHREIAAAAEAAIGSETDPEKKLRKLYARAQEIKNLSYERERSAEEEKKEKLKPAESVMDVLQRGYGSRTDVNRFFVALARASGFEASVGKVSNRSERFFQKTIFDRRQLDSEIAIVKVGTEDAFLDPGTKFCPYGFVRWMRTSTSALKLDKKGGTFVTVPTAYHDKSQISRSVNAELEEDGTLKGDLTAEFKGGEALERRLDEYLADEEGRKKYLEDEVRTWLPNGANVKISNMSGWDATDTPLTAKITFELASYGSLAGKRLLVPPYMFQVKQKDAFAHSERKYPVYFPYTFDEIDLVSIKFPAGYSMEGTAPKQELRLPYAAYQNVSQFNSSKLVTQRNLLVNGIFFDQKNYNEIKDFFTKVQAADEQQAVLRTGGVNAQKSN